MRPFLIVLLSGLIVAACQAPTPTPQEEAMISADVSSRVEGYFQAIRDLDLEYMEGFWADAEGFTFAGDGNLIVGYDTWIEQLRSLVASIESVAYVEESDRQIYVLGPDAASCSLAYRWSFNMKDGTVLSAEGSWMYVLKRFPEGWKVIHSAGTHIYS